ncbi:uncharacterized protein LOC144874801 [Branchiostoma floridae x Branchiostoma japonicum]
MARTKITRKRETTRSTKTVTSGRVDGHRIARAQSTSSSSGSDSEPKKKGGNRKRHMASSGPGSSHSTSTTAAKRSRPKHNVPAVEYRKRRISAVAMKKWKPISSETKLMTWNIMDAAFTSVLSSIKPGRRGFNEVQDQLNNLRDGISERLSTVKAPAKKVDHTAIHAKRKMIREDLKMQEEQLAVLEAEIKRLEKAVSKKEKKVDRLKSAAETATEIELHPILENLPAPCLNLPPLTTGDQYRSQAPTGTTPAQLLQSIINGD